MGVVERVVVVRSKQEGAGYGHLDGWQDALRCVWPPYDASDGWGGSQEITENHSSHGNAKGSG